MIALHLDECPFETPSAIPTYMVSKLRPASEGVLSGTAGTIVSRIRPVSGGSAVADVGCQAGSSCPAPSVAGFPMADRAEFHLRHLAAEGAERYFDSTTLFRQEERINLFLPAIRGNAGG